MTLLNGVPRSWINCKNGLRQGDPLSPYLFIVVVDILQQLICSNTDILQPLHPLFSHLPRTILQYADDTLIIARASIPVAIRLKVILDEFFVATGLAINFSKQPLSLSMLPPPNFGRNCNVTGCSSSSFPQIYLGLPLSPTRPAPNAFLSVLESCKKFLTGWRTKLLAKDDHIILIIVVLDSLLTYFMSICQIQKKVIEIIYALRSAFFWITEDTCSGAQCLIAWNNVCKPQKYGVLGIKNQHTQNNCLLIKFVVKSLLPSYSPWLDWLDLQHPNTTLLRRVIPV